MATSPCSRRVSGVTSAFASNVLERRQVHDVVLDAERVLEALRLRRAPVQRRLAAFEAGRHRAARALALGAAAGGLAALAADARPTRRFGRREPGAGLRSWTFTGSPLRRRDAAPGRASRGSRGGRADVLLEPIGRARARAACRGASASSRSVDRTSVTLSCRAIAHATSVTSCLPALALAVRVEHALGGDLFRRLAAQLGDVVGPAQRRAGPAIVARATLIAFDEPSDLASTSWMPAASRIARAAPPAITPVPGDGRLQQHPRRVVLTEHHVGDRRTRERHREEVLLGLLHALLDRGRALPWPCRSRARRCPSPSPTTTSAVNENRRPPFTTLATRLMAMTRSSY